MGGLITARDRVAHCYGEIIHIHFSGSGLHSGPRRAECAGSGSQGRAGECFGARGTFGTKRCPSYPTRIQPGAHDATGADE